MSIAPAVPPGKDLIRTAISALHSDDDLSRIEAAFSRAAKRI
jgi:7-keto-8-aminopelargonate synthetase-like enzyme